MGENSAIGIISYAEQRRREEARGEAYLAALNEPDQFVRDVESYEDADRVSNFGPAEVTAVEDSAVHGGADERDFLAQVLSDRILDEDVRVGATWRDSRGLFASWDDKIACLAVAYPVALHLAFWKKDALKVLLQHAPFDQKQRQPSLKNTALLALRLVAKPATPSDHKTASEYACLLQWAMAEQIPPEQFAERACATTLKAAKHYVRQSKACEVKLTSEDLLKGCHITLTLAQPGRTKRLLLSNDPKQAVTLLDLTDREDITSLEDLAEAILLNLLPVK